MSHARSINNTVIEDQDHATPSAIAWFRAGMAQLMVHVRHPSPEVRGLAWFGWALVASGLLHIVAWLVDGQPPLDGPIGWRKPIVFGLSGGVTTLALAALRTSARPSLRWSVLYGVTMAIEILLIDLQAWRGVGSHFNTTTVIDGAIFSLMGVVIMVSMIAGTRLAFGATAAHTSPDARDLRDASALATVALVVGSVIGIAIAVHGSIAQSAGLPTARIGAGEWKPVHAIALHGLQLFPIAAWWLRRRGTSLALRVRAVRGLGIAWGLTVAAAFIQLLMRRAPHDPSVASVVVVVAAVVVVALALAPVASRRSSRSILDTRLEAPVIH